MSSNNEISHFSSSNIDISSVDAPRATKISSQIVKAWVRFFARYIDIFLFTIILAAFFEITEISISHIPEIIFGLIIVFLWVFFESLLLSTLGATFGKWLLKISLRDKSGQKLTFKTALNRSFHVWFYGMGIGLPFISLFTMIFAHGSLRKNGVTVWDKRCNTVISHQKMGVVRILVAILLMVAAILSIYFGG